MSDGQGGLPSYKDLENAVLDGTAAIHCLTHERDHLRSRVELQERELVSLRVTNDDLRRQLMTIGESYMKFAASCISQLETISSPCKSSRIGTVSLPIAARRCKPVRRLRRLIAQ